MEKSDIEKIAKELEDKKGEDIEVFCVNKKNSISDKLYVKGKVDFIQNDPFTRIFIKKANGVSKGIILEDEGLISQIKVGGKVIYKKE